MNNIDSLNKHVFISIFVYLYIHKRTQKKFLKNFKNWKSCKIECEQSFIFKAIYIESYVFKTSKKFCWSGQDLVGLTCTAASLLVSLSYTSLRSFLILSVASSSCSSSSSSSSSSSLTTHKQEMKWNKNIIGSLQTKTSWSNVQLL